MWKQNQKDETKIHPSKGFSVLCLFLQSPGYCLAHGCSAGTLLRSIPWGAAFTGRSGAADTADAFPAS